MRAGKALVQLKNPGAICPAKPFELMNGEHTLLSEDKKTLLTEVDGYPVLSQKTTREVDLIAVSMIPLLSLSEDKMQADISLFPPVNDCPELTGKILFDILTEKGIRIGLELENLENLLARCKNEKVILRNETIARGLLPINGKDSFLRFAIEIGPLPGKMMGNGKIDFRERKMFVGVKKKQIIATRIAATNGTPGVNVLGEEVPQTPGKNLPVVISDDTEFDEESGIIRATRRGILSLVNENSIKVCAKQVISGNIDYSTGNIESQDAVEIGGTILPGFKVTTHGDLLLGGNARSAAINCHGNLVVKGGIIGKQCDINVQGDADFNFMEQGRLRANGKTIIRKQAYYCKIMADGDIHCKENSQIMAAVLMSGANLSVGNVGSPKSPPARLAAGVSPDHYLRYLEMQYQLRSIEQERLTFLQRHGMNKKTALRESLEESINTLYHEMATLNLIPNSADDSGLEYIQKITITVKGTIFSGTELQIGNATTTIHKHLRAVCFSLDKYTLALTRTSL
ncbi:MAG TPA: DUF342 domain-containing protein [Desulfobacterales bacterium]|nr:DUF342 domain-containing protein [Desulfobacterales bacterium]HIP40077.1 DUF342 domain-containing protein [Desulfocapsa sulfexigens]